MLKESRATRKETESAKVPAARQAMAEVAYEALKNDPGFAEAPTQFMEVFREFLQGLEGHMQQDFGKPLTLQTLTEAKLKALQFAVDTGTLDKLVKAQCEAAGMAGGLMEQMLQSATQMIPMVIGQLKEMTQNLPELLSQMGVTEEQVMRSEKIGLNPTTSKLYAKGTLTVGDVFVLQPALIVKNTD